jgi:hypothetical protein
MLDLSLKRRVNVGLPNDPGEPASRHSTGVGVMLGLNFWNSTHYVVG